VIIVLQVIVVVATLVIVVRAAKASLVDDDIKHREQISTKTTPRNLLEEKKIRMSTRIAV
jgi:hypothetical protein